MHVQRRQFLLIIIKSKVKFEHVALTKLLNKSTSNLSQYLVLLILSVLFFFNNLS